MILHAFARFWRRLARRALEEETGPVATHHNVFCILLMALDIERTPEASKARMYSMAVSLCRNIPVIKAI